jgi:PAS domain S-box-containing protein
LLFPTGIVRPPQSQPTDVAFEALAETSPDAIVTIDDQSTILSANPATERLFGYRIEELIGQRLTIVIPERLRAAHEAGMARYLATGRPNIPWSGVRLPAMTKDGREIPVEIAFGEFSDDSGVRRFSGFIRDVSERVRYEQEIEQARAVAEAALRETAQLSSITDVALTRATYDEMLSELLRRLRQELRGDTAAVLLLAPDEGVLIPFAADGLEAELPANVRVPLGRGIAGRVAQSGKPVVIDDIRMVEVVAPVLAEQMMSLAAVPVHSGDDVIGVVHVASRTPRRFTDADTRLLEIVAERMSGVLSRTRLFQAERRAREMERTLRKISQAIAGAMTSREVMMHAARGAVEVSGAVGAYVEQVIDDNADVEIVAVAGEWTPSVGQMVPYPGSLTEEIIAAREPIFLVRMEGIGAAMAPYLARQCDDCSALVLPLLDKSTVLGAVILLRRGDEPAFEPSIVDRVRTVTDLASLALQRMNALEESERRRGQAEAAVKSRDDMLSIVSHDLRNPVNTIVMSASLLGDPEITLPAAEITRQLQVIGRSARRMNRLIQDLLDVGRIEAGRFTLSCRPEETSAIVREVCEEFRPQIEHKELTLRCNVAADLPRMNVDRDRVIQVLSNFLNNAIKFTPRGGEIAVTAMAMQDGGVQFSVRDSGPGIAPDDLASIFDRFWQAKRTAHLGAGLGLTIAKGIASAHGGCVRAESALGRGSTFHLELPKSVRCA